MQPRLSDDALIARDGARLPLRRWPAAEHPEGVVIALHGFSDYSAAFEDLGPWLADRGFETFAYDQRGFGAAPHPGMWSGTESLTNDLLDAIAAVRQDLEAYDLPVYVLGESMGGSVAIVTAAMTKAPDLAGLILAAPGVRGEIPFRPMWDALFWTAAHLAPGFTVTLEPDEDRPLVPAATERFRDDPLVTRDIRADYYYGVVQLADEAGPASEKIHVPTLMLYGGEDELINQESICAAYEQIASNKTLLVYQNAPHLLLHWQERQRVLDDIEAWLAGNGGVLKSSATCQAGRQTASR